MIRRPVLPLLLALGAVLAGCSARKVPEPQGEEQDPAVSGALGEQLMTDPDLARINPDNRALSGGGPAAAPIPLEDRSPEAVARARAEATRLVGAQLAAQPAALPPPAGPGALGPRDTPALAVIAALGPAGQGCAAQLEYGFVWAARVPATFPIYPRGHAQDAAGIDGKGCALRVVNYVTPVPVAEVGAFYWAMARRARMVAEHRLAGRDHAIVARTGAGTAVAIIAARDDGLTQVDLVTSGL